MNNGVVYQCIRCGWSGDKSKTAHPKHSPEETLCPECHEVSEAIECCSVCHSTDQTIRGIDRVHGDPECGYECISGWHSVRNLHAVALGRLGGLASKGKTSEAKKKASRENGKKGGWPKGKPRISRKFRETAASHKAADERCGRPWQCACAACIQVRLGINKTEYLNRLKVSREK